MMMHTVGGGIGVTWECAKDFITRYGVKPSCKYASGELYYLLIIPSEDFILHCTVEKTEDSSEEQRDFETFFDIT